MDPFSIVSSTQAVGRRFTFYVTVQVVSVLAPGIVDIIGIIFLVGFFRNQVSSNSAQTLAKEFSGAAAIFASFVLLAVGFVGGYIFRELGFQLLGRIERLRYFRDRVRTGSYDYVADHFPPELIKKCFDLHPLLAGAYQVYRELTATSESEKSSPEGTTAPEGTTTGAVSSSEENGSNTPQVAQVVRQWKAGGGHVDDIAYAGFIYAKLWIRNYTPGFSIDNIEAEINILASGLAPTLLMGLIIVASSHAAWWSIIISIFFVIITWSMLLSSALRLRRAEKMEAIRNLVLDYSMRQAAEGYPAAVQTPHGD